MRYSASKQRRQWGESKNSRFNGNCRERGNSGKAGRSELHELPPQAFRDGFGARFGVEFAEQ